MHSRFFDRRSASMATRISRRSVVRNLGLAGTSVMALGVFGLRSSGAAQQEGLPPAWFRTSQSCRDDATCGLHTQVLFGAGPVYASHLPLFMFDSPGNHPHHYQVITEVTLPDDAMSIYLDDREATSAPLYTLEPTVAYRMLDLVNASLSQSPVQTLTGNIVRGHWERPQSQQPFSIELAAIGTDVSAAVERVVYAHEFSPHPAPLDRLEYVLFGSGKEQFLAHRVTAAPDFDQLLPVTIESGAFSDGQLRQGIILAIPERQNGIADRLMVGDQVTAEARHAATGVALTARDPGTGSPAAEGIQLLAGREFFFEDGELAESSTMRPTQNEIDAGFAFP